MFDFIVAKHIGDVHAAAAQRTAGMSPMCASRELELNKKSEVGNFLLSQEAALQVPSADTRLTSGFGMFPGIPTLLWSPTSLLYLQNFFMRSYSEFFILPSYFFIHNM